MTGQSERSAPGPQCPTGPTHDDAGVLRNNTGVLRNDAGAAPTRRESALNRIGSSAGWSLRRPPRTPPSCVERVSASLTTPVRRRTPPVRLPHTPPDSRAPHDPAATRAASPSSMSRTRPRTALVGLAVLALTATGVATTAAPPHRETPPGASSGPMSPSSTGPGPPTTSTPPSRRPPTRPSSARPATSSSSPRAPTAPPTEPMTRSPPPTSSTPNSATTRWSPVWAPPRRT